MPNCGGGSKPRQYTWDRLQAAVHFRDDHPEVSVREVARMFEVPVTTLQDHSRRGKYAGYRTTFGPEKSLTTEEETALVGYIIYMSEHGYPLTRKTIKSLVKEILLKAGRPTLINLDKGPSDKWVSKFIKKQSQLTERRPDPVDRERAGVKYDKVQEFYDLLESTMSRHSLQNRPAQIYNADETGISGKESSRIRVVVKKGSKHSYQRSVSFPSHTTIHACGSASGQILPPLIIFSQSMPRQMDDLPEGWIVEKNKTGYITDELFLEWFENIFLKFITRERPVILILDNHRSHLTGAVIDSAKKNNIILLYLPSHATHLLQPLDNCYFTLLKKEMGEVAVSLGYGGMRTVPKTSFVKCVQYAMGRITVDHLKASFRGTGIYPLRSNAVRPDQCLTVDNPNEPDEICETCGNPSANPLVRLGIVPKNLEQILCAPPKPKKAKITNAVNRRSATLIEPQQEVDNSTLTSQPEGPPQDQPVDQPEGTPSVIETPSQIQLKQQPKGKSSKGKSSKGKASKKNPVSISDITEESSPRPGPSHGIIHNIGNDADTANSTEDEDVCCICEQFSPPGLRKSTNIKIVNWAQCDRCNHWTHLEFCCPEIEAPSVFLCPHCHVRSTRTRNIKRPAMSEE